MPCASDVKAFFPALSLSNQRYGVGSWLGSAHDLGIDNIQPPCNPDIRIRVELCTMIKETLAWTVNDGGEQLMSPSVYSDKGENILDCINDDGLCRYFHHKRE